VTTLPRKFSQFADAASVMGRARVHPLCIDLWKHNRESRGGDTFIGMTDTRDWSFYIAPCFGVSTADQQRIKTGLEARHRDDRFALNTAIVNTYARADLSALITNVTASSTATGATVQVPLATLEHVYGRGNLVLVQLTVDTDKGFDGKSHAALTSWIAAHPAIRLPEAGTSGLKLNSLGFAIQRDTSGYYIRFASSLNEVWGQGQLNMKGDVVDRGPSANVKRTFEYRPLGGTAADDAKRLGYEKTREKRDLPKEWAQFFELILARDLKLALINAGAKHDRIVSRGIAGASSKLRRFDVINPDAYLDARHPGTVGTDHRIV